MFRIPTLTALAFGAFAASSAMAGDLTLTLDAWSGGYKVQNNTVSSTTIKDRGTLAIQQNDVALAIRSGGRGDVNIDATTKSLGYAEQKVRLTGVEVSGDGALAIHQGVLGVVIN
jgi:hypothetical protein